MLTDIPGLSESKEITIEGSFPKSLTFGNESERERIFTAQILLPGNDELYSVVKEFKFTVKVIDQAINTYLIVNGTTENKHIVLGDNLAFSIIAKNNGQQDFENVQLKSIINSQPMDILDWNKLQDDFFGKIEKIDNGKQIIWDKTQIPKLANLKAGEEITVNFSLPVKQLTEFETVNLASLGQTKIEAHSEIALNTEPDALTAAVVSSQVALILNTDINVGAKALYYFDDGTPIGSGPLPLKSGETTGLKIFWDVSNDLHEVENLLISAELPEYVSWPNETNTTAGELRFDPSTRKVSWEINRLPESIKEAHASFTIVVTPLSADKGKIIKLLGNTTLSAKDVSTGDLIIKTKNILTSALEQDQNAETDGLIQ